MAGRVPDDAVANLARVVHPCVTREGVTARYAAVRFRLALPVNVFECRPFGHGGDRSLSVGRFAEGRAAAWRNQLCLGDRRHVVGRHDPGNDFADRFAHRLDLIALARMAMRCCMSPPASKLASFNSGVGLALVEACGGTFL
jgi:hypothetical protein